MEGGREKRKEGRNKRERGEWVVSGGENRREGGRKGRKEGRKEREKQVGLLRRR